MTPSRWISPCLGLTLALSGCGGDAKTVTTTDSANRIPSPEPVVYSRGARLAAGSTARLLSTPTLKLLVTCNDQRADVSVAVKGATADAVISSYRGDTIQPELDQGRPLVVPMAVPDIQTWTIAPFSAGETQPTTLTIGARAVDPGTYFDCAVMAQAVIGGKVSSITK